MNINSGQSLVWNAIFSATGYDVELLNESLGQSLVTINSVDNIVTAEELFSGRPFGNYNVRVRATEAAGPGAWSEIVQLSFVSLSAPTNIHVE